MTIAVLVLGGLFTLLTGIFIGFGWGMAGTTKIVKGMTPEERAGFRAASSRSRFEGGKL